MSELEAKAIQGRFAPLVSHRNAIAEIPTCVAGVDVGPPDARRMACAAAAVLSLPDLRPLQVVRSRATVTYPYVSGLLAFRKAPLMLEALSGLEARPDFVIVGGHGLAHPRRFGLACHLGLLSGVPTIGCAGSALAGTHGFLAPEKGPSTPLTEDGQVIGAVLRTRDNTRPVYVSVGHDVDLKAAVRWALACCAGYRLPEPVRAARRAAREQA